MRLTGENEGDGENDKEATVETDTKSCPGQSRLNQAERKTEKNPFIILNDNTSKHCINSKVHRHFIRSGV